VYDEESGRGLVGIPMTEAELAYLKFSSTQEYLSVVIVESFPLHFLDEFVYFGKACKETYSNTIALLHRHRAISPVWESQRKYLLLPEGKKIVMIAGRYYEAKFTSPSSDLLLAPVASYA
jgi:hypothetical protein